MEERGQPLHQVVQWKGGSLNADLLQYYNAFSIFSIKTVAELPPSSPSKMLLEPKPVWEELKFRV